VKVCPVSYFTVARSVSYMIYDQRIIMFWKKALSSDNSVIRTVAMLNRCNIGLILCKYRIPSVNINVSDKQRMWQHFVDGAYTNGKITFY